MAGYDFAPCSIFQDPRIDQNVSSQRPPKVVEDTTPQKVEDIAAAAILKKRSCIATPNPRKEVPPHPGRHRKTVAFGKTVNVSQTVEGTSRAAKKAASPVQTQKMAETNHEDLLKIIHDEMAVTRREMQEENARKQEELHEQSMKKMQEMMALVFQQVATQPAKQLEEKENENRQYYRQKSQPPPCSAKKLSMARQMVQKEGRIVPEALQCLERRLQTDPLFRQKVDDILAEAEYEVDRNNAYSPPPPAHSDFQPQPSPMYMGGANPSRMMRETLTVERSIRYDNGVSSLDSRQWTAGRNYEPDPVLQSTYQPGNSISYYPTAPAVRGNEAYFVEHIPEEDDIDVTTHRGNRGPGDEETKEERERRIREKYSKKR